MIWDDAVLSPQTLKQIEVITTWLQHNEALMKDDNLSRKLKPGYRVLFYGPSGTGKTLTASLLGKQFQKDVYRIDLSQVVSKYIGETEKNLEKVFSKAENKNWILFFDEADALFGKRTSVSNAHDRYANQEVSYLLQRVEDFPGLIILASNFKANIDSSFIRRFNQIIFFPVPNESERLILWQKAMPSMLNLHPETNLPEIAKQYEITGAAIINVMQYAALQAIKRNDFLIHARDLVEGIQREFQKEDKSV
jgi:SpoVK/Ycf46/Vps4 family AAA+-type ATPase